jgi:diguanylate cyclase (GGDEF)-like protein/PAS domain S-box-containing protein
VRGAARLARRAATAALVAGGLAAAAESAGLLERLDRPLRDAALRLLVAPPMPDLALVEVDEASLAAHGRWPWPRRLQAELIERIAAAAPRAIGMAILAAEPDPADPGGDARLARAVAAAGNVVLPVVGAVAHGGGPALERLPYPELAAAAAGLGHADLPVDADGLTRAVALRAGLDGAVWPAFALCLRAVGEGTPEGCAIRPADDPPTLGWSRAEPRLVALAGAARNRTRIAADDLLADRVPATAMAGRWVLVGVTAAGLDAGLRVPGIGAAEPLPALAYHARVLEAARAGLLIALPPAGQGGALAALAAALAAGLAVAVRPRLVPALVLLAGLGLASLVLARLGGLWLSPVAPALTLALVAAGRPLGRLLRLRVRLAAMRARHRAMLEAIADAVIGTDAAQRISFVNPAAERLLGAPRARLLGRPLAATVRVAEPPPDPAEGIDPLAVAAGSDRIARLCRADGGERSVRLVERGLGRAGGGGGVLVLSDVTRQVELASELARLAGQDGLTGLANRRLLLERLERALGQASRRDGRLAVLYVDLDRFKPVNEALGHGVGDALLVQVAERLGGAVRATDTVARLGGDEFVVLLDPVREEPDAARAAAAILAALATPFEVQGQELAVGASIGIATYPADGDAADELLRRADIAMYRSKTGGGGSFTFYSADLHAAVLERLELDRGLRRALAQDELVLYYQPTVRLPDGGLTGVEALLRWRHPARGLLPPGDFIGQAEQTGLIVPIGAWALRAACREVARWAGAEQHRLAVAVNVSTRQLRRGDLLPIVAEALADSRLPPDRLVLEITESALLDDLETAGRTLAALKDRGVRLALDDFGTGYSSLGYLKRLPLDCLKIDRSFVQRIGASGDDEAIVRAIIGLAETLRLSVVAEGVEHPEQARFLARSGCRVAQGYLFGRPVPPEVLAGRLQAAAATPLSRPIAPGSG